MFVSLNQLGSMILDVNGNQMDVKYLNNQGEVTDYFTIQKNTTPPPPPVSPSALMASATSSSQVQLTWTDNSDNETGFDVERSLDQNQWNVVSSVGINQEGFFDTGLESETAYYYRVRAKNSGGTSSYSNVANATTDAPSPIETQTLRNGESGYNGSEDSFVASGNEQANWGSEVYVNADGDDGSNEQLVALLKWDTTNIPSSVAVTAAEIELTVFNPSNGDYDLYAMSGPWTESDVTWSNGNINNNQGVFVGSMAPSATGTYRIELNTDGLGLVQGWISGQPNHGFILRSGGTTDGVDFRSSEYSNLPERPALSVTYETGQSGSVPNAPTVLNALPMSSQQIELSWSDNANNEYGFKIERRDANQGWQEIANVPENLDTFSDSGLTPNTVYDYRVRAYNGFGESAYINIASATTDPTNTPITIQFQQGNNGYFGAQDTFVASGKGNNNYGSSTIVEGDGSDGSNGELVGLMKWDLNGIPNSATILSAKVRLRVSNRSHGTYGLFAMQDSWSEGTATWNNTGINNSQGIEVANFTPSSTGYYSLELNGEGVALVQGWLSGGNQGLMLRTLGTTDGVIIRSSEYSTQSYRPQLEITYQ